MIKINPDWWKGIFDEIYLKTDARSVCDDEVTCREVDFLEQVFEFDKMKHRVPWQFFWHQDDY